MNLHTLKPAAGSVKKAKRIGRGEGSGRGGTSTRGNKGAQRSASYKVRRASEGGQMPLQRRLPKVGFNNIHRVSYKVFNTGNIDALVERYKLTSFDPESLYVVGLVNRTDLVKVLGRGEIKSKINFKVHAISASAKAAVEALGGTVELVQN